LTDEDREFLKGVYQTLQDRPLEAGDPLYEPVYSHEGCEDPVDLLYGAIRYCETDSVHLFSGFKGSGKTTELYRLTQLLRDKGYTVLYASALDFVNPAASIDITVLLFAIANAFEEALRREGLEITGDGYAVRFWNWLTRTNVDLKEIGLKAGADLKFELRDTPLFREKLSNALKGRTAELHGEVIAFVEDGVKAIRKARGEDVRVVFLFDSLEQLQGDVGDEGVMDSIVHVFANFFKFLELNYLHVVYTVPPWLKFRLPTMPVPVRLLPCLRLWDRDSQRPTFAHGIAALRRLVDRRLPGRGLNRLLGEKPQHTVDRLIELSGGHFRDLLFLLREIVLHARSLPVTLDTVESSILSVRSQFLPISLDDARWLAEIERERGTTPLKSRETKEIRRLTFLLDHHYVLFLRNGEDWYDVHPLIRDEVLRIAKSAEPTRTT